MNQPAPNSPEFARLAAGEQRNILEDRAIKAGVISYVDLFAQVDEPEEPETWYYNDGTTALKRWQDNKHLARCSEIVPFKHLTLRGEKR